MTVPFGMGTDYDSDWNQSRRGIKATILTLDFNPSVAWKVSEKLSIGAGVSLQYASADLKMRMNLSDTTPGQQANSALNNALAEAIKNQDAAAIKQIQEIGNAVKDGSAQSEIDADSWAWGWNIGVMWSPVQNFRVGLSYRSEITHDADGDLKVNGLQGVVPGNWQESALGSIISGAISQSLGTMDGAATVSAPAWAMASVAWDVNDLLSLYASFRWTDWSSFDKLDIEGNGTTMATITNKWKDTYLGSLGADLRLTDWWTLRGGIAYESSPISDPSYRTAIIPDADRWWFAIGSSFKLTDQLIWDVSFAHLHGVHERNLYAAEGSNEKVGRFRKLDAYLLGTQLQYRF